MAAKSRRAARRLLVQAWYQAQLSGHDLDQLRKQFVEHPNYASVDQEYFDTLLGEINAERSELDSAIAEFGDIPAEQLDPVEHAILWVALIELRLHPDVPPKVVINEAINLAKMFGGEGGHRYVNALLDKAAAGVLHKTGNTG